MGQRRSESRTNADAPPPPLSLRVLGELTVERDGKRAELPPSKKTRALLGYLLIEPREHTREDLCALFWDGPDDPRGALRWSLSRLRPLLEGKAGASLQADRERVQLQPGAALVDLAAAQALHKRGLPAAAEEELLAAAELFRGDLLGGLELSEAFRFHSWCTAWREQAHRLRVGIVGALADRLADRPEEALPVARSLVALEPAVEAAHARVMRLLAALGRPKEAVRQYDECREILRSQLGARPSAAIEEVRRSLGTAPAAAASDPKPSTPQPIAAGPRLACVGRDQELASAFAALRSTPPKVALILGEPGIGKTRLLEELIHRARAEGAGIVSGRSHEAEVARPYGPFIDALRASQLPAQAPEALRQDLAALLPELAAQAPNADRGRLYDAVANLLGQAAAGRPLLLVLDDAHWIDEASASLAHYLARTLQCRGASMALAARAGELPDNPAAQRLVRALKREGQIAEIAVQPLGEAAVTELLAASGLRVDAARVHLGSQGNPLFALEIGRALDEGRDLASGTLADILDQRLIAVDEAAQGVLAFGAALGRAWDLPLLAAATGKSSGELLDALEHLERHGLVRARDGAAWDFVHDLVREAAFRRVAPARRRAIHAAVAKAIWEGAEGQRSQAGAVAHHALLAGDDALAVRASVHAARHALRVFAAEEAYAIAARALTRTSAIPGAEGRAARLALLEAGVFSKAAPAERLEADLASLSDLALDAEAAGDPGVVAGAFHALSWAHYFREDERSALAGSLQSAEAAEGSQDPALRARALAQAGRCLAQIERDIPAAQAMLAKGGAAAKEAGLALADLGLGEGLVKAFLGDPGATASLEEGAAVAHATGDHWRESECLFALARIALEVGDAAAALQNARRVQPVATKLAGGYEPAVARGLLSLAELFSGDEAAAPVFEAACAEMLRLEAHWRLAWMLALRGELALRRGRLDEAERLAREALALPGSSAVPVRQSRGAILLAEIALARGDPGAARRHAEEALAANRSQSAWLRGRLAAISARLEEARGSTVPHTIAATAAGKKRSDARGRKP